MARILANRLLAPIAGGLAALVLLSLPLVETPSAAPPGGGIPSGPAEPALQTLQQNALDHGSVPVIVGFDISDSQPGGFRPGGLFNQAADRAAQQAAIRQVQDRLLQRTAGLYAANVKRFGHIPFVALRAGPHALAALARMPEVTSIEPDRLVEPVLAQSVPLIGGEAAWAAGYTGEGQAVAVLDTGVDKFHSFLAGKVASEACYSTTGDGGSFTATTVCPNGLDAQTGDGAGVNCPTSIYGCSHGTHVAGIAAGSGSSFSGVAKDASLIAVQVFTELSDKSLADPQPDVCGSLPDPCAQAYTSDIILGLERVYALRDTLAIASVNMSLGGGRYTSAAACDTDNPSTKAAIDNLRSVGIATVVASGNSGYTDSLSYPACISSAVSVGATTEADAIASYSNSASFLDLLAPGSSITSSVPGGSFSTWNGTSMATPHVAGAWAVLKGKSPAATVDEILSELVGSGKAILDSRNGVTKPRIDLSAVAGIAPLAIDTAGLPGGAVGEPYSEILSASGGAPPYGWAVIGGQLPDSIGLSPATGALSGTPTKTGLAEFTVRVTDAKGISADKDLSIDIASMPREDLAWVDDTVPAGATLSGTNGVQEPWQWVASDPTPYIGTQAHQSTLTSGLHQHFFYSAADTLAVDVGNTLFVYVYLDPDNSPREVMVQWRVGSSWEHRAYWGDNLIDWGTDGTDSRRYMGPLPPTGQWVRLEVPAADVGLEGATVNGMAFTLYDGRATWDHAGMSTTPPAPQLGFSAADYTVDEGGVEATITVSRTGSSSGAVSADYATADGSATAGTDYTSSSGTVSFADGDSADKIFNVPVLEDSNAEGNETVALELTNPTGIAVLGTQSTATLTITDNEAAPTHAIIGAITDDGGTPLASVSVSADGEATCGDSDTVGTYSCSAPEGWSGGLTPALSGYLFSPISRSYSSLSADQSGQDFTASPGITWVDDTVPAGATLSGTNGVQEPWQWVASDPTPYIGTQAHQSTLTSGLHQHFFYSAADTLAVDVGNTLFVYVYLDPDNSPREVMVQWRVGSSWEHRAYWGDNLIDWGTDGTDSRRYMGPLPPTGQWVRLEVPAADVGLEGATVNGMAFTLYDGRATWDHAGMSTTPPAPQLGFSAADYTVDEGGVEATITVSRTGSSSGAVSADYATADGSATAGTDYTSSSGTVSFADGDSADKIFNVPVLEDSNAEGNETVALELTNPTGIAVLGTQSTATLTITDNEAAPTHAIIGAITDDGGTPLASVSVSADGEATCGDSDTVGTYSCSAPEGWSGGLTPALSGYLFSPISRSYSSLSADQSGQDFTASPGITWVDDTVPAGATLSGTNGVQEPWQWVASDPTPYIGTQAHQSTLTSGLHQHFFYSAADTLAVDVGNTLFVYVYLDPDNSPREVMVQWRVGSSWEHRAYWGDNLIDWGTDGTDSRRYMGPLPPTGQWVRLEVPAADVGLEGATVNGMAFTLYDGRATWDHAGTTRPRGL